MKHKTKTDKHFIKRYKYINDIASKKIWGYVKGNECDFNQARH